MFHCNVVSFIFDRVFSVNSDGVLRSKSTVKKGLLWQQRDKLFSQWKERYFILTTDYLQCFKKGSSKVTEMGEFIFKVRRGSKSALTKCFVKTVRATHYSIIVGESSNLRQ